MEDHSGSQSEFRVIAFDYKVAGVLSKEMKNFGSDEWEPLTNVYNQNSEKIHYLPQNFAGRNMSWVELKSFCGKCRLQPAPGQQIRFRSYFRPITVHLSDKNSPKHRIRSHIRASPCMQQRIIFEKQPLLTTTVPEQPLTEERFSS